MPGRINSLLSFDTTRTAWEMKKIVEGKDGPLTSNDRAGTKTDKKATS
jgi:hypothetical protein